jgi:pimeloyl-ACP methyl ester carboxylesterase
MSTPVVALAGTFCDPQIFARLAAISEGYDLHALSWMTDAPAWTLDALAGWVAGVIEDTFDEKVLLIGHSTGGAIALRLTVMRPDLLRGLMLINTGPNMHRRHGDVLRVIADVEESGTAHAVPRVLQRSFHVQPQQEDLESLLAYGHAVPPLVAREVMRSQHATDLTPCLPAVHVPVTVVHGRHDLKRSVSEARLMADTVPNGDLVLADCGHSPMYELPEIVLCALHDLGRRS